MAKVLGSIAIVGILLTAVLDTVGAAKAGHRPRLIAADPKPNRPPRKKRACTLSGRTRTAPEQ